MKTAHQLIPIIVISMLISCQSADELESLVVSPDGLIEKPIELKDETQTPYFKLDDLSQAFCQDGFQYHYNQTKRFVICQCDTPKTEGLNFFVYDLINQRLVYQYQGGPGSVSWYNNRALEFTQIPGMFYEGQTLLDVTYIYDLFTGKLVKKADYVMIKKEIK